MSGGGARQRNLTSRLRFCAVAVSRTSSLVPLKPRSLSRSSLRMRFRCANRISTFLRSRRNCSKASVLASTRTRSCAVAFPGWEGHQDPDPPDGLGLLRRRRDRPCGRPPRAAMNSRRFICWTDIQTPQGSASPAARWRVDIIRRRAEHLGMVEVANAEEAIKIAASVQPHCCSPCWNAAMRRFPSASSAAKGMRSMGDSEIEHYKKWPSVANAERLILARRYDCRSAFDLFDRLRRPL